MLARDSIDYCQDKKLPLALIKIDQEKAFCRVNLDFLLKVLEQVFFTPVRRRALLITISDASPDISDDEIRFELEKHGTAQRVWKQTWAGFPNIFNGKRLVTIYPSGCKELPPLYLSTTAKFCFPLRENQFSVTYV